MHQTFYIDIDEEITSIIEKIKKAKAKEVIMVVPKRALLIQSVVNLKILKKEADENGIQLMIVTQDKLGKALIEKTGIFVQQKVDNISEEEIDIDEKDILDEDYKNNENMVGFSGGNSRLDKIGSKNYFDEDNQENFKKGKEKIKIKKSLDSSENKIKNENKENLTNKELVFGSGVSNKKNMDFKSTPKLKKNLFALSKNKNISNNEDDSQDLPEDKKIENFFFQKDDLTKKRREDSFEEHDLSGKAYKWFWIFGGISLFIFIGIMIYLFIPKASLLISVKTKIETIDSELRADSSIEKIDQEEEKIPAKIISFQKEISKNFDSSGDRSVSNQKSRGKITIYNEYSSSSQPLVATTRFLSEDGKLFRLIEGVTVPGTTKVGDETQPGKIEAEVMADESGESFNIEPTKFSIPGFKDSGVEKYNKFYAISEEKMKGGGNGGEKISVVTEGDISSAKVKIMPELEEAIKKEIQNLAGEDIIILDEALIKEEAVYKLSNSEGDMADSFQITVQTKVDAIVFRKNDFKEMVAYMISKAKDGKLDIDEDSIEFDFGRPEVSLESGIIDIKFKANGKLRPNIDLDSIKEEILGKNEKDLRDYLGTFSDIEKVEITYWPFFADGRIPFQKGRVDLMLDNR
jgi:hypothetical protein